MTYLDDYHKLLSGKWTDIRFHLPYLRKVARSYDAPDILECGVRSGNSTITFMSVIEEKGGSLISCDINSPDIEPEYMAQLLADNWVFYQGSDLGLEFEPGSYDIIFLDSSHHLYHTLQELRKFKPALKPGGRFLMHDTEWGGMDTPGAEHMHGENWGRGPVAWALDEFCKEQGLMWVGHPGSYGLGEICLP